METIKNFNQQQEKKILMSLMDNKPMKTYLQLVPLKEFESKHSVKVGSGVGSESTTQRLKMKQFKQGVQGIVNKKNVNYVSLLDKDLNQKITEMNEAYFKQLQEQVAQANISFLPTLGKAIHNKIMPQRRDIHRRMTKKLTNNIDPGSIQKFPKTRDSS